MCSIIGYIGHRLTAESVKPYFDRTISRGPDMSRIISIPGGFLGFHRLAIMGLTEMGMQPFVRENTAVVCNGEIYGFRAILGTSAKAGLYLHSGSDCENSAAAVRRNGRGDVPAAGRRVCHDPL